MVADSCDGLPPLIAALLLPEAYPHPVEAVQLVETHISWVLLTGNWAYKIKKPIDLGFVQAGCLSQRQHFCREELRLNRRLAPDLYCAVVSVLGPAERARISLVEAAEGLIEPAVRMRQFPAPSLLSRCLADGVPRSSFEQLAEDLARFHHQAEAAPVGGRFGSIDAVVEPVETNLRVLEEEMRSKPLQEQWNVLLDVRDHFHGDEDEHEEAGGAVAGRGAGEERAMDVPCNAL